MPRLWSSYHSSRCCPFSQVFHFRQSYLWYIIVQSLHNLQGGDVDLEQRYVAPTILRYVSPASPAMSEEIFGPVLPILTYESLGEAISVYCILLSTAYNCSSSLNALILLHFICLPKVKKTNAEFLQKPALEVVSINGSCKNSHLFIH